jgi:fibronectin type 3 domain-containing protein
MYALAGKPGANDLPAKYPYDNPVALNDVTSGSNGICPFNKYLCQARAGYDGPTGLGTPNTAAAFGPIVTTVPGAPQSFAAAAGVGQVTLSWKAPASSGGAPVTSYDVYRGPAVGSESLLASGVTTPSYVDAAVTNGSTYYYKVTAVNSVGQGPATADAVAIPGVVPRAPSNLTAKAATLGGITLSWTAPAANGAPPVTGYRIYRGSTSGAETYLVSVSCSVDVCSYKDASTAHLGTYFYEVSAVNVAGEGTRSNEASAQSH